MQTRNQIAESIKDGGRMNLIIGTKTELINFIEEQQKDGRDLLNDETFEYFTVGNRYAWGFTC